MAKHKTDEAQGEYIPEQEAQPAPQYVAEVKQPEKLYRVSQWKGIKEVYQCKQCGQFRDTQDQIKEHILLHYPPEKQADILDQLLKE